MAHSNGKILGRCGPHIMERMLLIGCYEKSRTWSEDGLLFGDCSFNCPAADQEEFLASVMVRWVRHGTGFQHRLERLQIVTRARSSFQNVPVGGLTFFGNGQAFKWVSR